MSIDTPPLLPDADTARRWAEEELAKDEYTRGGESWLAKFWDWLMRAFDDFGSGVGGALGSTGTIIAILVGAGLIALVVWLVVGPLRRSRRAVTEDGLFEDDRTADALGRSAEAAAAAGEWAAATLDMYRALIRRLAERDIIALTPGLTAHESATQAGAAVPSIASRVGDDADAFDGIRYGHVGASAETYAHVRETWVACAHVRRTLDTADTADAANSADAAGAATSEARA
ncbi:MAG: DUF4129 domain-containing protein [Actinomycetes bacterium]